MNKKTLLKIVGEDESLNIEWKPSLSQVNEIIETISGFSNAEGGKIIIGVSKSGKLLGVGIGKDTIEHLTNKIAQNTDPKIHPRITTEKINGKFLIVIKVEESADHLVLAFGRPFKRVGKSTVRMSKDEYEKIILEKHKDKLYFDSQICKGASLKDIDRVKINEFLKKAKLERGLNINENISTEDVLTRLKLCHNGKLLTNAAILLFGKNPQKFFLQVEVRCARFKGTKPIDFIDMKVLRSDIISQKLLFDKIHRAMGYRYQ